jgi:predicted RNA binding protein YcfA (HicA-like mRNA interferase family)
LLESTARSVSFRDFERLLLAFGFTHDRTVGSHRQYLHPEVPRSFPVQPQDKDAKRYQVREFLELVETYGLDIEA